MTDEVEPIAPPVPEPKLCKRVNKRTGRHRRIAPCHRHAPPDSDYCWQHRVKQGRNWAAVKERGGSIMSSYHTSRSAFEALNKMAEESQISKSGILECLIEGAALRGARFVKTAPGIIREVPPTSRPRP